FALPLPLSQKNLPEIVTSLRLHDRRNLGLQPSGGVGWVLPLLLACSSALADSTLAQVSFRNDVMAALSKAGCNAGTCHGNKNGKGGFKLSLRGQDPDLDYLTLTRDLLARRANPLAAEQRLVLLKLTTQVAHEGGLRFKKDSPEYEILRRWIA